MKIKAVSILITSLIILGCVTTPATPPKTQLEIREFQTRDYDTSDVKMVMKSLLNVLQDDGYIVGTASMELGLLSAGKEVNIENKGEAVIMTILGGQHARWKQQSRLLCSGNVTEMGKVTKVRVNFQLKTFDNKGAMIDVKTIEDPQFYQEFFAKVDKGIFIGKQKL